MSSDRTQCKHDHDNLCFLCGEYLFGVNGRKFDNSPKFLNAYKARYMVDATKRSFEWSPKVACTSCYRRIPAKFSSPTFWNPPENHPQDCYFCMTEIGKGVNKLRKAKVEYPFVSTVEKAEIDPRFFGMNFEDDTVLTENFEFDDIPMYIGEHSAMEIESDEQAHSSASFPDNAATFSSSQQHEFIVPRPPDQIESHQEVTSEFVSESSGEVWNVPRRLTYYHEDLPPVRTEQPPIHVTQEIMNDIVRDSDLTKQNAELLASRFKQICPNTGKFFSL